MKKIFQKSVETPIKSGYFHTCNRPVSGRFRPSPPSRCLLARASWSTEGWIVNKTFTDFQSRQPSGATTAHTRRLPGRGSSPVGHLLTYMKVIEYSRPEAALAD